MNSDVICITLLLCRLNWGVINPPKDEWHGSLIPRDKSLNPLGVTHSSEIAIGTIWAFWVIRSRIPAITDSWHLISWQGPISFPGMDK